MTPFTDNIVEDFDIDNKIASMKQNINVSSEISVEEQYKYERLIFQKNYINNAKNIERLKDLAVELRENSVNNFENLSKKKKNECKNNCLNYGELEVLYFLEFVKSKDYQLEKINQENQELKGKINELNCTVKNSNNDISKLNSVISEHAKEIKELKNENGKLEKESKEFAEKVANLQNSYDELLEKRNALKNKVTELIEKTNRLENENIAFEVEIETKKKQLKIAKNTNSVIGKEKRKLEDKNGSLREKISELEEEIKVLNMKLNFLKVQKGKEAATDESVSQEQDDKKANILDLKNKSSNVSDKTPVGEERNIEVWYINVFKNIPKIIKDFLVGSNNINGNNEDIQAHNLEALRKGEYLITSDGRKIYPRNAMYKAKGTRNEIEKVNSKMRKETIDTGKRPNTVYNKTCDLIVNAFRALTKPSKQGANTNTMIQGPSQGK